MEQFTRGVDADPTRGSAALLYQAARRREQVACRGNFAENCYGQASHGSQADEHDEEMLGRSSYDSRRKKPAN